MYPNDPKDRKNILEEEKLSSRLSSAKGNIEVFSNNADLVVTSCLT